MAETRLRYKIHGDPRCASGNRINGQFWLVIEGTLEASCEVCASSYGDPRRTPRPTRRRVRTT